MLSALYAIVRPSITQVDQSKTVEVRTMTFSPYGSPIPITSFPERGRQTREGWENKPYLSTMCQPVADNAGRRHLCSAARGDFAVPATSTL